MRTLSDVRGYDYQKSTLKASRNNSGLSWYIPFLQNADNNRYISALQRVLIDTKKEIRAENVRETAFIGYLTDPYRHAVFVWEKVTFLE